MSSAISSLLQSAGRTAFEVAFVYSPIILTGGIATNYGVDGMLPIATLVSTLSTLANTISANLNAENYAATFMPVPGSTLQEVDIGSYPFANQATAANATIGNSLHVSMMMYAPANSAGAYTAKLATMTALKLTMDQHRALGGTYTVLTPAYSYFNCICTKLSDVSTDQSKQTQYAWQFDFVQPLITLAQANQVYNTYIQKASQGLPNDGTTSGPNVLGGSGISSSSTTTLNNMLGSA